MGLHHLGYIVLGYLLERTSGQTYEEFVRENFSTARDERLGTHVVCEYHSATCVGYWPGNNGIENADRSFDARIGFSSGSLYSSTEDLLRWNEGLFGASY